MVPAALVGTLNFNVAQVDRTTLRLARVDGQGTYVAPSHCNVCDVAVPFPDHGCDCHTLTHDGVPDLGLIFNKHTLVSNLRLNFEANNSYLPVVITGKLLTGESFSAYDCIRVLTH